MYKYDWSLVICTKDINEKVDVFLRITNALINESHAEKTVESNDKDKPFITQKIKSLMIKGGRAFGNNDNGHFRYYQSLIANEIRKAKSFMIIRLVRYGNLV